MTGNDLNGILFGVRVRGVVVPNGEQGVFSFGPFLEGSYIKSVVCVFDVFDSFVTASVALSAGRVDDISAIVGGKQLISGDTGIPTAINLSRTGESRIIVSERIVSPFSYVGVALNPSAFGTGNLLGFISIESFS